MTVLGQRGITIDGTYARIVLVSIFVLSLYFYMVFKPRVQGERKLIVSLIAFGLLFYSTRLFHSTTPDAFNLYNGQLLRWGADCVPACLIGVSLIKLNDYSYIHKILPWLCLLLTPFMSYGVLTMGQDNGQYFLDGGFNYQVIAYQMAVMCCYSFFYTFIYKNKSNALLKIITCVAMMIQAATCLMSGGRGGVVLLFAYMLYMVYFLHKWKGVSFVKIIFFGIAILAAMFIVANYMGVMDSAGFARSSGLMDDKDRYEQWGQYIPYLSEHMLLGWGLGGDYFTVGFYSHNIFLDWYLETGVIGTLVLFHIFLKSYKRLVTLTTMDDIYIVVMIYFIYGLVFNLFSGYWISQNSNWLLFGIAATYSYEYNKRNA